MADQDERITFFRELHGFNVNLRDQRAGRVNHSQLAIFAGLAHLGRNAVRTIYDPLAGRHFVDRINKNSAFALKFFNHKTVVDDFFADVNRRPKGLEGDAHNINGADDAGAEAEASTTVRFSGSQTRNLPWFVTRP